MIYSDKSGNEEAVSGIGWTPCSLPGPGGAKAPGGRAEIGGSQLGAGGDSLRLRLRQLRKHHRPPFPSQPPPPTPGLLSAIHPLELACRDHFRKPVGGWKQLVSRAGGRLRAAENE